MKNPGQMLVCVLRDSVDFSQLFRHFGKILNGRIFNDYYTRSFCISSHPHVTINSFFTQHSGLQSIIEILWEKKCHTNQSIAEIFSEIR